MKLDYEWINESKVQDCENGIAVYATPGKDFFNLWAEISLEKMNPQMVMHLLK